MIRTVLISVGACYLPAMIYFTPPQMIAEPISRMAQVQLSEIEGTPWQGKAWMHSQKTTGEGSVHWQFDFSGLLRLQARWLINTQHQVGLLQISATELEAVTWRSEYNARLWTQQGIKVEQIGVEWLRAGNCESLHGKVQFTKASIKGFEIPDIVGDLNCTKGRYQLDLSSPNKQAALEGFLDYNPETQSYKIEIRWRPDAATRKKARESGYPLTDGRLELKQNGNLASHSQIPE